MRSLTRHADLGMLGTHATRDRPMMLRAVLLTLVLCGASSLMAQAPRTHTFTPQRFYNTFCGAHPPALRIKPGERVVTKTLDASGVDWNGKQVANGPNPQTGPFFVEGAEPGDMLVVSIEKLETNRAHGVLEQPAGAVRGRSGALHRSRRSRAAARRRGLLDKAKGVGAARRMPRLGDASSCRCGRCSAASASRRRARRRSRPARPARSAATWTTPGSTPA